MAELQILGLDGLLNLVLLIIELVFFIGFVIIYVRKKNAVLRPLIWSIAMFIMSNILALTFSVIYDGTLDWKIIPIILAHLFVGGGLLFLIYYLEMFESDEPFTRRSTIGTILIMLTSVLQLISNFIQPAIGLLVPIPYVITGIMYMKYIRNIRNRVTIRSQKKKVRTVGTGVFMIYIAPLLIYLTLILVFGVFIITTDTSTLEQYVSREPESFNIGSLDPITMLSQLAGIILLGVPVLVSQSPYFMQSRKISRLTIISNSGLPIYDFNFDPKYDGNELLLSGALTAIKSVMTEATGSSTELRSIIFGDLHIITEVRDGFAANLIVESSSAFLKESLRLFTDEFYILYKLKSDDSVVIDPHLHKEADKLLQRIFGISAEEMDEILSYPQLSTEQPSVA
jgi:hypothetical protein